jgi:sugar (pentulose or hexulose) kinase
MKALPVIAVLDVGKTNKKFFLFDQQYHIVLERSVNVHEIDDEDGDPCDNIEGIKYLLFDFLDEALRHDEFVIRAINYSAYGASFVYVDKNGQTIAPLYNYLKKYPAHLHQQFYDEYGGETEFSHRTASPILGSLNSGLQLYRMKYERPEIFNQIFYALHLPQYMSYLITGKAVSEMTSIGCHTGLWDFSKNSYHEWVEKEGIISKLAPIYPSTDTLEVSYKKHAFISGIGLHDSSAALIPYLIHFNEPFVLLSTGTWNITMNPFNQELLTTSELQNDCLCYISYKGIPVKASRLFSGHEHEEHVKILAAHFDKAPGYYKNVGFDPQMIKRSESSSERFPDPASCNSFEEAYHQFLFYLVKKQFVSSGFVITANIKKIFVDGGFSQNPLFMNMLASLYPGMEVYGASIVQSTALGAALAIHDKWNNYPLPDSFIDLKHYPPGFSF